MLKNSLNMIIITVVVLISSCLFSNVFQNRKKSNDTISVTGSGKKDFVSDLIVWIGPFNTQSKNKTANITVRLVYQVNYNLRFQNISSRAQSRLCVESRLRST